MKTEAHARTTLPKLYKMTNTSAIQEWSISYERQLPTNFGIVRTVFGQRGSDSPQTVEDVIKVGKNKGRANETSAFQQAEAEARAKWEKQIKKGYSEDIKKAESGDKGLPSIDPMLAHKWSDQKKGVEYPCYLQPKLDGLRNVCVVTNGKPTFYSRTRKPFNNIPHLLEQMTKLCKLNGITDAIFDGELYSDEYKDNFNEIVSRIKRDDLHPDVGVIDYHIYDLPSSGNADFESRSTTLAAYFRGMEKHTPSIRLVETIKCSSPSEITEYFEKCIDGGYEGIMVRATEGKYENKRSKHLLKYKEFEDAEFRVVGVQEGRGKLMGCAGSFVCVTKEGKTFNAKLKGELKNLKEYFDNFDAKYKGKMLTVQYFRLTPDLIPRFPVAQRFHVGL